MLCKERGIATGGPVAQVDNIEAMIESGVQYLMYGTDLILLRREAERAATALKPLRQRQRK